MAARGVAEEQNPSGSKSQAYFIRLVEAGWVEDGKEVAPAKSWRRIGSLLSSHSLLDSSPPSLPCVIRCLPQLTLALL
jgi:hypothetical protein